MTSVGQLDGNTTVVGVIGWPVRHSLSPPMQNAAIAALELNWVYVPFPVHPSNIQQAVDGVRALNLAGINVTVPHKQDVAGLVDELDETAARLQAVNTIVNNDGRLVGHNTDGPGFLRSLQQAGESVRDRKVAIIGAGGAARSVAYAVASSRAAELAIVNRTVSRARRLAQVVRNNTGVPVTAVDLQAAEAPDTVSEAEIVVNATPVGMFPDADVPPVVPPEWLHSQQCVYDLVYTPRNTTLLQAAEEKNATTIDGTGMLVHQGAIALKLWTGMEPPVAKMHQALLAALQRRESAESCP